MKFASIASGSSGNSIFLGTEHTSVLIDAGISGRRIKEGLAGIDRSLSDIDALFITHEHIDHVRGLGILMRRYGIPVYATGGTIARIRAMECLGKLPEELLRRIPEGEDVIVGDMKVHPFPVSHDAAEPCAYRIESGGRSAAVATDMGIYDENVIQNLTGLDALLLESNHDLHMLQAGRYPYYLKRRIMGEKGHLSNDDAGRLLCSVLHDDLRYVFLGHLSQENNYEELAFETVTQEVTLGDNPYKASDFDISIAHRDRPGKPVEF